MATFLPDATITRTQMKGYRVFLYSHDHPHPPHVHFGKHRRVSAWDLSLLECRDEDGFSSSEIAKQRRLLKKHVDAIWRNWNEHWKKQSGHAIP